MSGEACRIRTFGTCRSSGSSARNCVEYVKQLIYVDMFYMFVVIIEQRYCFQMLFWQDDARDDGEEMKDCFMSLGSILCGKLGVKSEPLIP